MKKKSRWNRNYNSKPQRAPQPYFNFNSITVHFRDCQLWLLLSEIKTYCLWSVSAGIFLFFFTHGDWKGTFIYACPVCHMWGLPEHGNLRKHQSSSTIWVFRWLQLISHIVTVLLQVKQTPCVKRPFFFTNIKSSCISKLWTACSQRAFTIMSRNPKSHTHCTVFIAGHW